MRTVGLLYFGLMIAVMTIGIVSSLTMKSSYAATIRDNLDDSIVLSVKMLQTDRDLVVYTDETGATHDVPVRDVNWETSMGNDEVGKFKSDFISYLSSNLDSRIDSIDVNIYGVDVGVGALSVEVIAHFTYPSGQIDTVESYKTVILNKYAD